ncbi:MAG: hypothetical protein ACYTGZ_22575, partial [Planctomycetota bacterium]
LAQRYLEQHPRRDLDNAYVRTLLACACLAVGRVDDAAEYVRWLEVPPVGSPEHTRRAIASIQWLVPACRAIVGRLALDDVIRAEDGVVEFVETYGNYVGYILPRKHSRDYLVVLERHVLDFQGTVFPRRPWGPRKLERRARKIAAMRSRLSEQAYNDAASLLTTLSALEKEKPNRADAFFAAASSSLYITLALLSEDLLPRVKMEPSQKQWVREQALSTYERARGVARNYIGARELPALEDGLLPPAHGTPEECYRRLYARLFIAQKEVLAWITIQ